MSIIVKYLLRGIIISSKYPSHGIQTQLPDADWHDSSCGSEQKTQIYGSMTFGIRATQMEFGTRTIRGMEGSYHNIRETGLLTFA